LSSTKPFPVRFDTIESKALDIVGAKTGLSRTDLIRRSVRLASQYIQDHGVEKFILATADSRLAEMPETPEQTFRPIAKPKPVSYRKATSKKNQKSGGGTMAA